MKKKSTILFMILTLLTNNIVLASTSLLDQHEYNTSLAELALDMHTHADDDPNDHSDHANHCCHIQAHFVTLLSSNSSVFARINSGQTIPQLNEYAISHSYSPPTPPPKA